MPIVEMIDDGLEVHDTERALPASQPCPVFHDPIEHPSHYTSSAARCHHCGEPIECIDITSTMSFLRGNALKYLWRAGLKGDAIEDLKKSARYITHEIQKLLRDAK